MKIKKLLPFIGIALFIYIVYRIGLENIIAAFIKVNPYYLLLGALAILFKPFLESWKWYSILKSQGIKVDFPYL